MIEYRKLTHEDYEDILDLCRNIWDGCDYLPQYFHRWVDDKGLFLGAVDAETGKVVGVDKFSILYDGSGWLEGLRVHPGYRGRKIARELAERVFNRAKEYLEEGKINKIGFSTHGTNIESITLMTKMGFYKAQEYILVSKDFTNIEDSLDIRQFVIKEWNLTYEEFVNMNCIKRRDGVLPLAYVFQKPTRELYEELKDEGYFISINGFNGIYKQKMETYLVPEFDTYENIKTLIDYFVLKLKNEGKDNLPPYVSIIKDDFELLEQLKMKNFNSMFEWKPDYYYYVYNG